MTTLSAMLAATAAEPSPVAEPSTVEGTGGEDHRRWRRWAVGGGTLALVVQYWMLTAGTWNPLRWDRLADLYDVQARAMLDGTLAMDQQVLGIESFGRGDEVFMYFGPMPAMLRLPIASFTDRSDGRLAVLSMLLALGVILAVVVALGWQIRSRILGQLPVSRTEAVAVAVFVFVVVGGSSLLYAGARTWVYNEAIVWGVAWTLATYWALLRWLEHRDTRLIVWASLFAALAMTTRPSVGGGAVAALGAVLAGGVLDRARMRVPRTDRVLRPFRLAGEPVPTRVIATLTGAVGAPVAVYASINWLKFRTLFSVPFEQQGFSLLSERRREVLAANDGSLFGWKYVPTNLVNYLRPDSLRLDGTFPFIHFRPITSTIGEPLYDLIDVTAGLPATMPLLVGLAVVGLVAVLRSDRAALVDLRPILVGCMLATIAVLTIGYLANRYQNDFLPAVVIPALAGLAVVTRWCHGRTRAKAGLVLGALGVAALFGVLANAALGYTYQRAYAPTTRPAQLAGYVDTQLDVDQAIGDGRLGHLSQGPVLPPEGRLGDVFVVGACEGVYWSSGSPDFGFEGSRWSSVQLAADHGGFRATLRFDASGDARRLPVLAMPGGGAEQPGRTIFVVPDLDAGTVTFGITGVGDPVVGRPIDLADGAVEIHALVDPAVGVIEVYAGDRIALYAEDPPGSAFEVGVNEHADPLLTDAFRGAIDVEPVDMDLCDRLLDALER